MSAQDQCATEETCQMIHIIWERPVGNILGCEGPALIDRVTHQTLIDAVNGCYVIGFETD